MPMNPSVTKTLETYFPERQARGGHLSDPDDRYIREEFRKQGMLKIQALYRAWRRDGDGVLWQAHSTTLRDDHSHGCSAIDVELLNRQYLQLTGMMDRDVWAKRGAKRKSRQVGPQFRRLSRTLSLLWSPMSATRKQTLDAAYCAAPATTRRRCLPPRLRVPVPRVAVCAPRSCRRIAPPGYTFARPDPTARIW